MADQTLQEIRDRLNIAEVIGGYIQVKKAGGNFKAVCPFHSEKTPSLMISPSKQIWHCFGCGEGGDVFTFVMRYENLEFREALKILADKAGVQLPQYHPTDKKAEDEKELLLKINDFAARFYQQILLKDRRGTEALDYLIKRGLSKATIEKWMIGYAPDEFHALEEALKQKQVESAYLIKAGVIVKNEKGQMYDRFRGRITFPVFNNFGEIVAFSARILPRLDNGALGKYINSPETLIYNKSKILFGLNFAKADIRKKDEAVLAEGQMDCISAHQAGFTNVVATSGTALTEGQLSILSRLTRNLKFCFDADSAGLLAAKKAIERYLGADFTIKIVKLEGAKDPDELIKISPAKFEQAVKEAPLFLDYYFEKSFEHFSSSSVEQKKQIAKEILPLLKFLTDPLELEHYIKLLANKLQTSEKALWEKLIAIKTTNQAGMLKPPIDAAGSPKKDLIRNDSLEKEVLGGMLVYPDFLRSVSKLVKAEDFENPEIRKIAEGLLADPPANFDVNASTVAKEAVFMVESLLYEFEGDEEILKRQLSRSVNFLRLKEIKKEQQQLQFKIKSAELSQDKAKLDQLKEEFAQLAKVRTSFEKTF